MSTLTQLPDRDAAIALHEKIVRASRGVLTSATAAEVAKAIEVNPMQLVAAWRVLGAWAIRQLDRMVLMENRKRDRHATREKAPREEQAAGQVIDPNRTRSWYEKLPLWKRPVAIGNTGKRKALGELTHGDCQTIAQFYGRSSTTMREKADRWSAISRALNPKETLGGARQKLAEATLEFLRDETGGEMGHD